MNRPSAREEVPAFVPFRSARAQDGSAVLPAHIVLPGVLPQPVGIGFFPALRLLRRAIPDGPLLAFATLDAKDRWPDTKRPSPHSPTWATVIEGCWPILRRSLVEPLLTAPIARGEVELRPVTIGRALARRDGRVDPSKGSLDDDWVWLDVKARMPLDRDRANPSCFRADPAFRCESADPSRPHASIVTAQPERPSWGLHRQPRFDIFRIGECPASVYVSDRLWTALRQAFGDALEIGEAPWFAPLAGGYTGPRFAQSDEESRASAEAFWRIHASGGAGSARDRALAIASPIYAYWLALLVDRGPSDATRAGALAHPTFALAYARDVDRSPREDTRDATTDPDAMIEYARDVDANVHPSLRSRVTGYAALRLQDIERTLKAEEVLAESAPAHAVLQAADEALARGPVNLRAKGPAREVAKATAPSVPIVFGFAVERRDGRLHTGYDEGYHPDALFPPGPWTFHLPARNPTLRKRLASKGSIGLDALQEGPYGAIILRRSRVEPILANIPARELTLRPVRLVDDAGTLDEDFVALEIHARFPLDRADRHVECVDPDRPHDALVRGASRFQWSPDRAPRFRVFRIAEIPGVVMMAPDLFDALRRVLPRTLSPFEGIPRYARAEPAFWIDPAAPIAPSTFTESQARDAADALFALYRTEKEPHLRARALAHPYWACWLAGLIDEGPGEDTRAAALREPHAAALYARFIDRALREDTRAASERSPSARAFVRARFVRVPAAQSAPALPASPPPSVYRPTSDDARAARRALVWTTHGPDTLPTHAPPDPALVVDLDRFTERALALVGASEDDPPADLAARVHAYIEEVRAGNRTIPRRDPESIALQLAVLWGHQLARALGWRWASVRLTEEPTLGLLSPDRAVFVCPLPLVRRALAKKNSNTTLLLFNMLRAGSLPPSDPGEYTPVG
jgi:hypothetical protein